MNEGKHSLFKNIKVNSPWILLALFCFGVFLYFDPTHSWIEIANATPIGAGMGDAFNPWPYMFITSKIAALFFLNSAVTMLFGYILFFQFWRQLEVSFSTQFIASFVPGYLSLCAIGRLCTFFFPHSVSPLLIVAMEILIAFVGIYIQKVDLKKSLSYRKKPGIWQVSTVIILFLVCFTQGIQWGYHFLTGDGTAFFLNYLKQTLPNLDTSSYLPLVDQHADELLYNYPLLYTFNSIQNPQILFWFFNVVGRLSMIFLTYSLFRYYKLNRSYSIMSTTFFFIGTTALNPTKYLLLFDGVNPLLYVLHIHRSLAAIIPFLWVGILETASKNRSEKFWYFVISIFIIGLLMTSIHNTIALVLTTIAWLLFGSIKKIPLAERSYKHIKFIFIFITAMPLLTYSLINSPIIGFQGILLLVAIILSGLALIALVDWNQLRSASSVHKNLIILIFTTLIIAGTTLGNVTTVILRRVLTTLDLAKYFNFQPILSRSMISMENPLKLFHFVGCDGPTSHCQSGMAFIGYYGIILALGVFVFVKTISIKKEPRFTHLLLFQIFMAIGCFLGALMIKDFFDKNTMAQGWLLTRLIEIPYYAILFLFFMISGRYGTARGRRWITLICFIWCITPFLSTDRFGQWVGNLNFLFKSNFFH